MRTPVSVGVIGLGAAGGALARTLAALPGCELRWVADHSAEALMQVMHRLPAPRSTGDLDDLLGDETLDAVAVATPPATRYGIARRALEAGKHVLVEAPAAIAGAYGDDLVQRARAGGRRLQMDDAVLYQPGLAELRELVAGGRLGDLYYVNAARQGLDGSLGAEGVLWRAGSAAVAIVLWLIADEPVEVTARGGSCRGDGAADLAFCNLRFATGIEAQLVLSALEPQESRRVTVVGSRGMATLDELQPSRALTVCDRASGEVVAPLLAAADPLTARVEQFVSGVRAPSYSRVDGREGASVIAVVEALERSLQEGGRPKPIGAPVEPEPIAAAGGPSARVIPLPVRSA